LAYITFDTKKLKSNYDYLNALFKKHEIEWSVVSKILSGNKLYLTELLSFGVNQICDSRVTNLKIIKSINPDIETVYIKPPAKRSIPSIVKYADISMNTEVETIKLLSKEAKKQNKTHKIIIMIELQDKSLKLSGASSDMIVIDLNENKNNYKVGDLIEFKLDYMGTLRIINSKYIEKRVVNSD
jgi:predicted amino acid racemase